MKKLLSCLLAVLLVCSLMSMSVFAADIPITDCTVEGCTAPDCTHHAVGQPGHGDINNGVGEDDDSFSNNNNADVTVNFGQITNPDGSTDSSDNPADSTIVHKYAVDILYGSFLLDLTNLDFDIDGNGTVEDTEKDKIFMVWNVNSYEYVPCFYDDENEKYIPATIVPDTPDAENEISDEALTTPVTLPGTVMITNHSDLSVETTVEIAPKANTLISWEIAATANGSTATEPTDGTAASNGDSKVQTVKKATAAANGTSGSPTTGATYTFTATPTDAEGWLGVIGNFINNNPTSATIGTITVTIEP